MLGSRAQLCRGVIQQVLTYNDQVDQLSEALVARKPFRQACQVLDPVQPCHAASITPLVEVAVHMDDHVCVYTCYSADHV